MGIPESQLETWSHQGATTTAKMTSDSIKNALNSYGNWTSGVECEVFLQGSYKNDTNIRGDMDVDVVALLTSSFCSNLSQEQKMQLNLSPASYNWMNFRNDVLNALKEHYGSIAEGNKSVKISGGNGRLPADVVVCVLYRKYRSLNANDYVEGMCFWSRNDDRRIINYPKIHYENGVTKNSKTNGGFKQTVRVIKSARVHLVGKGVIAEAVAPSYFIECLVYNVPNGEFGTSYQDTFCNLVNWLVSADLEGFRCVNEQLPLFGNSPEQWTVENVKVFLDALVSLWKNW